MLIVISSMADTGLPQELLNVSLGRCADQVTSFPCLFRFASAVAILSVLTSSFHANVILAATFHYFSPYEWMQVPLVTSLIRNLLTWAAFDRPQLDDPLKYTKLMVPTAIVSIAVRAQLLSTFLSAQNVLVNAVFDGLVWGMCELLVADEL